MCASSVSNWPGSSLAPRGMGVARSPAAMAVVAWTACRTGAVMERVVHQARNNPTRMASTVLPLTQAVLASALRVVSFRVLATPSSSVWVSSCSTAA